jgi:predicted nucleic acid-binding protein
MQRRERVLIDTAAFFALVAENDEFHLKAVEVYEALVEMSAELWTTSYVLVEAGALIHRRLGFQPLNVLYESLEGIMETLWVDQGLHNSAWQEFSSHRGERLSFVDCTTLLAAKALAAKVFTFDTDFSLEGIPVVP